jgi:DNA repair exonuclease SbcCD ATPase subunit
MGEIWKIRQEIKKSTMSHFKDNISAPAPVTYSRKSKKDLDDYVHDKENICHRSTKALDYLKQEFDRNVQLAQKESKELKKYKTQFDNDLKEMEIDLNHRLEQISYLNKQRLHDNKKMSSEHSEEMKELTEQYEDKLKRIREENTKSKSTIKELIISRESELVRINKEIENCTKEHEKSKQALKDQITKLKEEAKMNQKQRKVKEVDLEELKVLNAEAQKVNSLKLRKLRKMRSEASQLQQVNVAIKLAVDKLKGVAYGKTCKTASRNKSK